MSNGVAAAASETVMKAVDDTPNSKWCSFWPKDGSNLWIEFDFPRPIAISGFSFTSANDNDWRDPGKWTFEAFSIENSSKHAHEQLFEVGPGYFEERFLKKDFKLSQRVITKRIRFTFFKDFEGYVNNDHYDTPTFITQLSDICFNV
jgi:alpha-L-fucosidase 2